MFGGLYLKSTYREPKYKHLLHQNLRSSFTKSKNLNLHLYLIMYDDPETIPFDIIADRAGVKPNRIRALLRSVNDPKLYLGLVDVGVDSRDIPHWYARPKFIKKIRKSQARVSEETKVPSPDRTSVVTHPLQGIILPPTFRPSQVSEVKTNNYDDEYSNENYMSPAQAEMWLMFVERLREDNLREEKRREEKRKLKERANRALTPKELRALVEMHSLYQAVKSQREQDAYLYYNRIVQQKRARERTDFFEAIALFRETQGNVNHTLIKLNEPAKVTAKIVPYVPPNKDEFYQELREIQKVQKDERLAELKKLAKLGKDIQEKGRQEKQARHWRSNAKHRFIMKNALDYLRHP